VRRGRKEAHGTGPVRSGRRSRKGGRKGGHGDWAASDQAEKKEERSGPRGKRGNVGWFRGWAENGEKENFQ